MSNINEAWHSALNNPPSDNRLVYVRAEGGSHEVLAKYEFSPYGGGKRYWANHGGGIFFDIAEWRETSTAARKQELAAVTATPSVSLLQEGAADKAPLADAELAELAGLYGDYAEAEKSWDSSTPNIHYAQFVRLREEAEIAALKALPGLLARLAAAEAPKVDGWISRGERLPDDKLARIIAWHKGIDDDTWPQAPGPMIMDARQFINNPHIYTHWRPFAFAAPTQTVKGGQQDA